jgi:ABC-type thiamine transport system substrate-binding protein
MMAAVAIGKAFLFWQTHVFAGDGWHGLWLKKDTEAKSGTGKNAKAARTVEFV